MSDHPIRTLNRAIAPHLRRVLFYTHNSIGLGHAIRSLAVITGMRRHRPDLDFLVLTGSVLPQLFLAERVEVLRLPALRQDLDQDRPTLRPRLLRSMTATDLVALRRRVIVAAVLGFAPDAVIVEHYPAGLLGEALPLLGLGPEALDRQEYALVHLGRGRPFLPPWPETQLPDLSELLRAYDLLYALDHAPRQGAADGGRDRVHYLGPVASRTHSELAPRREVLARWGLDTRGMVLLSLGRGGPVVEMARCLLRALPGAGLRGRGVVMVLDPYLEPSAATQLQELAGRAGALVLPFVPYLVEAVAAAEMVICRGGYNTVVELLMTGVPALVVPERHPSGEQERRCRDLPAEQVVVADEREVCSGGAERLLRMVKALPRGKGREGFDKYVAGKRLVEDLEDWLRQRSGAGKP